MGRLPNITIPAYCWCPRLKKGQCDKTCPSWEARELYLANAKKEQMQKIIENGKKKPKEGKKNE